MLAFRSGLGVILTATLLVPLVAQDSGRERMLDSTSGLKYGGILRAHLATAPGNFLRAADGAGVGVRKVSVLRHSAALPWRGRTVRSRKQLALSPVRESAKSPWRDFEIVKAGGSLQGAKLPCAVQLDPKIPSREGRCEERAKTRRRNSHRSTGTIGQPVFDILRRARLVVQTLPQVFGVVVKNHPALHPEAIPRAFQRFPIELDGRPRRAAQEHAISSVGLGFLLPHDQLPIKGQIHVVVDRNRLFGGLCEVEDQGGNRHIDRPSHVHVLGPIFQRAVVRGRVAIASRPRGLSSR